MATIAKNQTLIRILTSLQKTGSISNTATELYLTQPNISKVLKQFETQLKVSLVNRTSRPLRLTAAGNYYLNQMGTVLNQVDQINANLSRFNLDQTASLRIGVTQSLGSVLLPKILPHFHQQHPEITVKLLEMAPAQGEHSLAGGQLDIYCGVAPTPQPAIIQQPLYTEGCTLMVPKSALPAEQQSDFKTILAVLQHQELIIESEDSGFQRLVSGFLAARNIHPWRTFSTANLITAERLAAKGMAAAIVPNSLIEPANIIPSVLTVRIPANDLNLGVIAQYTDQSKNNPLIQLFLDSIQ